MAAAWQPAVDAVAYLYDRMDPARLDAFEPEARLRAADLRDFCHNPPDEPMPAQLARDLSAMVGRLAEMAAAVRRRNVSVGPFLAIAYCFEAQLKLLEAGCLQLSEELWMRVITCAVLSLDVCAPFLHEAVALLAGGSSPFPPRVIDDWCLVDCSSRILYCLLYLLCLTSLVPPRVAAVLRAAHIKPAKLLAWMEAAVAATHASMNAEGTNRPPSRPMLATLNAVLFFEELSDLRQHVSERPELLGALTALVARCLILPEAGRAAVGCDPVYCEDLVAVCQLAHFSCLTQRLASHECAALSRQADGSTTLLAALAALAAQPQLLANRGIYEPAALLVTCLRLQANLASSGGAVVGAQLGLEQQQQQRRRWSALLLRQLGSPGGLPLVCQLATEVAAAAPGAPAALAAGSASSSSSSSNGSNSGGGFGALCWQELAGPWLDALHYLAACIESWQVPDLRDEADSATCAAACRAAEAALRLAPHLPLQPGGVHSRESSGGSSRQTMADVVAALPGGAEAAVRRWQAGGTLARATFVNNPAFILACDLNHLAGWFLVPATQQSATSSMAKAAFHLLSTSCRYIAALGSASAAAAAGEGRAGSSLLENPSLLLNAIVALGVHARWALCLNQQLAEALPEDEREPIVRRLECCLLLYLAAPPLLASLRTSMSGMPDPAAPGRFARAAARRCAMLLNWLEAPQLAPLWRLLLSPGSGVAPAGGVDAALVLADAAAACMQDVEVASAIAEATHSPSYKALLMLHRATELAPSAFARLAQHAPLLTALRHTAAEVAWLSDEQGRQVHRAVCSLLDGLEAEQQAGGEQGEQPPQQRQPASPEAQQLAVRRAHALALRRACANPRCAELAGSGEAAMRHGRFCTGCRVAPLCSDACQRAEWRTHKLACRQLSAQPADGA